MWPSHNEKGAKAIDRVPPNQPASAPQVRLAPMEVAPAKMSACLVPAPTGVADP